MQAKFLNLKWHLKKTTSLTLEMMEGLDARMDKFPLSNLQ